nr:MAG TPA: hypothetical protein [Caudoviricetes sp.]DAN30850.1 MAG TPA: hypothetical protein [Caudoviricetes sp.]
MGFKLPPPDLPAPRLFLRFEHPVQSVQSGVHLFWQEVLQYALFSAHPHAITPAQKCHTQIRRYYMPFDKRPLSVYFIDSVFFFVALSVLVARAGLFSFVYIFNLYLKFLHGILMNKEVMTWTLIIRAFPMW